MCPVWERGPLVALAKELTSKTTSHAQRTHNLAPDRRELQWWAKRQREAGVDQVRVGPGHLLHGRDSRAQVSALTPFGAAEQTLDGRRLGVNRQDAPAAAKQLERIATHTAPQVDGETATSCWRLAVEALQRMQQCWAGWCAGGGGVIRRPVCATAWGGHQIGKPASATVTIARRSTGREMCTARARRPE